MEERIRVLEALILFGMLGIYSWEDFRRRRISTEYLLIPAALGVILCVVGNSRSWPSILLGILVGGGVLLAAVVTRERIGAGDGLLLTVTGLYLGGAGNLQLLMNGLFLAAVFSLSSMIFRRWKKSHEIPFVPFLFVGYLTIFVGELL